MKIKYYLFVSYFSVFVWLGGINFTHLKNTYSVERQGCRVSQTLACGWEPKIIYFKGLRLMWDHDCHFFDFQLKISTLRQMENLGLPVINFEFFRSIFLWFRKEISETDLMIFFKEHRANNNFGTNNLSSAVHKWNFRQENWKVDFQNPWNVATIVSEISIPKYQIFSCLRILYNWHLLFKIRNDM